MSTLHEQLHGKSNQKSNQSSRTRENWGDFEIPETKTREDFPQVNWFLRGKIFLTTLTYLLGLFCYAVAYLIIFHHLQINWRLTQSGYLTQINSADVDKLAETMAREGIETGVYCLDQSDGNIKKTGNCKTLNDLAREEKQAAKKR